MIWAKNNEMYTHTLTLSNYSDKQKKQFACGLKSILTDFVLKITYLMKL